MRTALEPRTDRQVADEATRHTRALQGLTREVWHPDCTFDTALAEICRTAALTLAVARVNVWRIDSATSQLVCVHAYDQGSDHHALPDELEMLALDTAYASQLGRVRVVEYSDLNTGTASTPTSKDWLAYFKRHGIHSLLDAPVLVQGELLGVICHEQVGEAREWSEGERVFAGSMGDFVAMAYEIVRRRKAENEVRHLRLHDRTTDLPNRDFLFEALAQRMRLPHAADQAASVVHVKVSLPHGAPLPGQTGTMEDVITQVAKRLCVLVDERVQLSRARPDGFALVPGVTWTQRDVVRLAEQCVQAGQSPLEGDEGISILTSVGIAFAAPDDSNARTLMRQAEQAAEQAEAPGGGRYRVFDAEHHDKLVGRLALESELWRAFQKHGFEVYYQPEVCLESGRWLAAEALVRWLRDGEVVVAGEFIEVVESCGLVVPLGAWVMERACMDAAAWKSATGGQAPSLRVNLSARQFEAPGLVEMVAGCLERSGLPAQRLCLEITETTLMLDVEAATGLVVALRSLGVSIAIDDFGTGYSSFAHLKRFPVDILKIDRGFVAGVPGNAVDGAIIAAIRSLALGMDVGVVVEGVETHDQAQWLLAQGLRNAQGFLFAPALPHDELMSRFG